MKLRKYVIVNDITPVIFDGPIQHKDMQALGRVTSAGYFFWDGEHIQIAGEAFSIKVPNGPYDQALLEPYWEVAQL